MFKERLIKILRENDLAQRSEIWTRIGLKAWEQLTADGRACTIRANQDVTACTGAVLEVDSHPITVFFVANELFGVLNIKVLGEHISETEAVGKYAGHVFSHTFSAGHSK